MKRRKIIGWSRTRQGRRAVDHTCHCPDCEARAIIERAKLEMLLMLLAERRG